MQSTWSRILSEITTQSKLNPAAIDTVRREKITAIELITARPLIVYATAWTTPGRNVPQDLLQIDFSDKTGFRDVTEQLTGENLDILIHSPGGLAEATQGIVDGLRERFSSIRFIVPHAAKSAATMLALSGNVILMDEVSELGPIDPQMPIFQGGGVKYSPADAILGQFEDASKDIQEHPEKLSIWVPLLAQMGPSLLVECANAKLLSRTLVKEWLTKYMFKGEVDAADNAERISSYLADHKNFLSHSKRVSMTELVNLHCKVEDLRNAPNLRNAVWELYCAIDITMANSTACKIIENSSGHAVIRAQQVQQMFMPNPFGIQASLPAGLPTFPI
ncbi:MAG: serine protease [Nitrospirae bacterium]|nr:serine protease [Nitrospirota bacterium]